MPEFRSRQEYSLKSADVYGCGTILFVMCAGFLPFADDNADVLARKIAQGDWRFPKWFSDELQDVSIRREKTHKNRQQLRTPTLLSAQQKDTKMKARHTKHE
jgi:hypothetical protein